MFTGLIEAVGRLERLDVDGTSRRIRVATALAAELTVGESIAVNGVCLTAAAADGDGFDAIVSPEMLRVTTLGAAREGRLVNLERPLRADGRLGGHFVLGHVDGIGRVSGVMPDGDCYWVEVDVPAALEPLVILKGSISVDGISLTIASLDRCRVGLQIVPHTWSHTALVSVQAGDEVNVEVDVIGKYVARLLESRAAVGGLHGPGVSRS
jgi:riboflavin synthase